LGNRTENYKHLLGGSKIVQNWAILEKKIMKYPYRSN